MATPRSQQSDRREARWRRLVAEQRRSGLSQRSFCAQRGISLSTLGWWRQRLGCTRPGGEKPGAAASWQEAFVEVEIADGREAAAREPATEPPPIEVLLPSGATVIVRSGVDERDLRRVLSVVGVVSC